MPDPRKVVAGNFLSLDGARLIETQDAAILGRRTYDEWSGLWPASEIELA